MCAEFIKNDKMSANCSGADTSALIHCSKTLTLASMHTRMFILPRVGNNALLVSLQETSFRPLQRAI